jgi:hypothetical protein
MTNHARVFLLLLALTACSGPASSGSSASSPDGACTDWAARYCDRLNACSPFTLQFGYASVAECTARNKPVCLGGLSAPGTGATPAAVEACSGLFATDTCEDVIIRKPPQGCNVDGSLGAGKPCGDGSQCVGPDGYCKIDDNDTCGTCATLSGVGGSCSSDRDCAYGLICGTLTCQTPVKVGSQCDGATLFCQGSVLCADSTCVMPLGLGAPCTPQADLCDMDLGTCDPQSMVCTATAAPAPRGASCAGKACANGVCGAQGTCVAYPPDGSACDPTRGLYCASPAVCVNSVCVLADASQCH